MSVPELYSLAPNSALSFFLFLGRVQAKSEQGGGWVANDIKQLRFFTIQCCIGGDLTFFLVPLP